MTVPILKYGDLLVSRPAGREAAAAMLAYLPGVAPDEPVELDFTGVIVVAPSWLDEVLVALSERFGDRVRVLSSDNASLQASLRTLESVATTRRRGE